MQLQFIRILLYLMILPSVFSSLEEQHHQQLNVADPTRHTLGNVKRAKKLMKPEVTDDTDDDYNDDVDETDNAKQNRQRNINIVQRVGTTYAWDRWEKWSKCNNSCVQIKRRKCIERVQYEIALDATDNLFYPDLDRRTGCFGIFKRFRMCKDEKCRTNNHQLRDEQCTTLNKIAYKGKFYNWLGYEKEHNECELYCSPSDSDILISMNQSVTDGTPCEKPAVYYTHAYRRKAVCVEGICRAVHPTGAIRPATTSDSQVKCGSVLCQAVSEVFNKSKMSYGYNVITTIPAGAMNMTIKEMAKSDNMLALKTLDDIYLINGNSRASDGGIYEYNDDVYDYNREKGIITARGPIRRPIVLLLFSRGINPGIKYDYTLPVPSASISEEEDSQTQWNELGQPIDEIEENNIESIRTRERKRRKFTWKLLGFGQCNRSCGPGVQQPIFRCIRDSITRYYSPKRCALAEKPVFSEDIYHCNRGLCPAYWRLGDYSECKCDETTGEGKRTRFVKCVQEQITGAVENVNATQCAAEKLPDLEETCSCPQQTRRKIYIRDPEKTPKIYARLIAAPTVTTRHIQNSTTALKRNSRDDRPDKSGVWLMSQWSDECTELTCGVGYQQRSIYCDRTPPMVDLCDFRLTPEQRRSCTKLNDLDCSKGIWFASEWSNCSGDCFNLQRKRTVYCLRDGFVVTDAECSDAKKPIEVGNCTHKDVSYCGPKWHYSDWSECSRSCGEGVQRRSAKCLEYDWKLKTLTESTQCKYLDREPVYGACNTQKCEVPNKPYESIQNEPATVPESCNDEFTNCKRINPQRLCKLQYYKTYCCLTCNGYN